MPVIRGKPRGNGRQLGHYLMDKKDNDHIEVIEVFGTASEDVIKACVEMNLTSELTKTDKGLYHSQINPAIGEDRLTHEQWIMAADILGEELRLDGKKRVIVVHSKNGRNHAHVVWERFDYEKGKMASDSHNFKRHDAARQRMERVFNMRKTPLKNLKGPQIREMVTGLWEKHKTPEGFIMASQAIGLTVVRSDNRRPFMIMDETGRSYDLTRHLDNVRTAEVSARFKGIDLPKDREITALVNARKDEAKMNLTQDDMTETLDKFKKKRPKL